MKNLISTAVAVILFTTQAFAESTEIHPWEANCLKQGAQELVQMLADDGLEYEIIHGEGNLPEILKPLDDENDTYQLQSVQRYDDLEEYIYGSSFNFGSIYSVMKVTPQGCEAHASGSAQDDGD